jgi:hypothetical protein
LPPEQDVPAAQALPHAPQLLELVLRSMQLPEQSLWPFGQAHCPAEQYFPPLQTLPHAPQLVESLCRSAQMPLHRSRPAAHEPWH